MSKNKVRLQVVKNPTDKNKIRGIIPWNANSKSNQNCIRFQLSHFYNELINFEVFDALTAIILSLWITLVSIKNKTKTPKASSTKSNKIKFHTLKSESMKKKEIKKSTDITTHSLDKKDLFISKISLSKTKDLISTQDVYQRGWETTKKCKSKWRIHKL